MSDASPGLKELRRRADKAWQNRRVYDRTLRDVYDYVLPMRSVSGLHVPDGQSAGAPRTDKVFDATAPKAAFRFAGRLQSELTPLFQPFFSLEAGPLIVDKDKRKQLTEAFQAVGHMVHGVLASGAFHNASHEMYVELYAGTGVMFMPEGDDDEIVKFMVPPIQECAFEEDAYGEVTGLYWKRRLEGRHVEELWPPGKAGVAYSEQLRSALEADKSAEVEVCQYIYRDPAAKDWRLLVWDDKSDETAPPLWRESFRTKPFLSPRFFKVPGETMGRGPAQLAMPFIKTTNKARELALKAAAIALMGIWMYRNDGVFNPSTASFDPLKFWPVQSTGGGILGPSIARVPTPENFDVSTIIIADEREQMKLALFDDTLPPETGAVRSATEIAERISRLSQDLSGVYGRLTLEIVVPLVQRVIDILERRGLLDTSLKVDQLLTQVRVVAPIASGQQAAKVQSAVNWIEIIARTAGPQAALLAAEVEELYPEIGRWLGVEERFIRGAASKKQILALVAQLIAAQQAQAAGPPDPAQQQQALVNGGGV